MNLSEFGKCCANYVIPGATQLWNDPKQSDIG